MIKSRLFKHKDIDKLLGLGKLSKKIKKIQRKNKVWKVDLEIIRFIHGIFQIYGHRRQITLKFI